jgi:hypothetical protein
MHGRTVHPITLYYLLNAMLKKGSESEKVVSFSSYWNMVDIFTLEQATYFWCDHKPMMIATDFGGQS